MTSRLLIVLGVLLLAAGLAVGLTSASAHGTSCGSVFVSSNRADVADYANAFGGIRTDLAGQCADTLSGRRSVTLALLIPGVIALVAGAGMALTARARPHELDGQATHRI